VNVCVCVCVCACVCAWVCACVCVCVREQHMRQSDREREREQESVCASVYVDLKGWVGARDQARRVGVCANKCVCERVCRCLSVFVCKQTQGR